MLRLRDAADPSRGEAGPKARRLAAALRQGLCVPDGVVLLPGEPIELGPLAALLATVDGSPVAPRAGQRFAVRSSASAEDLAGQSAAGLFLSRTNVGLSELTVAIEEVRASGNSDAVRRYCGGAVAVAVLIQPMVVASRLGVLHLSPDGSALCEERPATAPEWANVMARPLAADDDSPLGRGARQLLALLRRESGPATAAYVEYALLESPPGVVFLQVRPAPLAPPNPTWATASSDENELCLIHDQEHNPDPLSLAQSGLVEGVADLVPALRQRVIHGYLYYAEVTPPTRASPSLPTLELGELEDRYRRDFAPACEALLQPLERQLAADDGALRPELLGHPERCTLELAAAFRAYRGVYERYVAELSPSLRRARKALHQLLDESLGESLSDPQHAALLDGAAAAPTERLQQLFELGQAGAEAGLLRAYLARYGAFAPCWDIAVACDDERPEAVAATALKLAQSADAQPSPREQHHSAQGRAEQALARLRPRLTVTAWELLLQRLPTARAAQRIAEEDDALFFRAQRLLRWVLLGRGARLVASRRLRQRDDIFDLPWSLQLDAPNASTTTDGGWGRSFAPGVDLAALAQAGAAARIAAAALVPPSRLLHGQPLWTPPRSEVLRGYGVSNGPCPIVRGQARVVRSLLPGPAPADFSDDTILVLPVLLPSWAADAWRARALITDGGGALSHGAILARERGVPAVVGTGVATRVIRDGQELWVDAERGLVYLIPPLAAEAPIDRR